MNLLINEKAFQAKVIELARTMGWTVAHFSDSRRQVKPGVFVGDKDAAGFPDLVLVRERVLFRELKAEKGRLSDKQAQWIADLEHAGADVKVWRPSDWVDVEQTLTRRRAA